MKCAVLWLVTQLCLTPCDPIDRSQPGASVHGDSLGKNTGVGCYALLQGTLLTPGVESTSLMSPGLAGFFIPAPPGKP